MCSGAREGRCWNSIAFNGELAAKRILETLTNQLRTVGEVEEQFAAMLNAANASNDELSVALAALREREEELARSQKNLVDAIANHGQAMFRRRGQFLDRIFCKAGS
jgi:ABC-type transporter Mla subunit MlaD